MIARVNGEAIRFFLAVTPGEADELMAGLSPEVLQDLTAELATSGEAHRYCLASRRAYYFRRPPQGNGLACWQWDGVNAYDEAARLLAAIIELDGPMTPAVAERLYRAAKVRPPAPSSDRPQPSLSS